MNTQLHFIQENLTVLEELREGDKLRILTRFEQLPEKGNIDSIETHRIAIDERYLQGLGRRYLSSDYHDRIIAFIKIILQKSVDMATCAHEQYIQQQQQDATGGGSTIFEKTPLEVLHQLGQAMNSAQKGLSRMGKTSYGSSQQVGIDIENIVNEMKDICQRINSFLLIPTLPGTPPPKLSPKEWPSMPVRPGQKN